MLMSCNTYTKNYQKCQPRTNFTIGFFCAARVPNRHNPSWAKRCAHYEDAAIRRSRFARLFSGKIDTGSRGSFSLKIFENS